MKHTILILILLSSSLSAFALNLKQFTGNFELESGDCPNRIIVKISSKRAIVINDLAAASYESPYLWFENINKGMQSWIAPPDYYNEGQIWDTSTYKRKSCFKSTLKKNQLTHYVKYFLGVYTMCMFVDLELGKRLQINGDTLHLYNFGSQCKYKKVVQP